MYLGVAGDEAAGEVVTPVEGDQAGDQPVAISPGVLRGVEGGGGQEILIQIRGDDVLYRGQAELLGPGVGGLLAGEVLVGDPVLGHDLANMRSTAGHLAQQVVGDRIQ